MTLLNQHLPVNHQLPTSTSTLSTSVLLKPLLCLCTWGHLNKTKKKQTKAYTFGRTLASEPKKVKRTRSRFSLWDGWCGCPGSRRELALTQKQQQKKTWNRFRKIGRSSVRRQPTGRCSVALKLRRLHREQCHHAEGVSKHASKNSWGSCYKHLAWLNTVFS